MIARTLVAALAMGSAAAAKPLRWVEDSPTFRAEWTAPSDVDAIPELRRTLLARRSRDVAAARADARGDSSARERPHFLSVRWDRVASTPAHLSLSAVISDYTGGAHGGLSFDGLVWDRRAKRARTGLDFARDIARFDAALSAPFCAALDRERARRRGEPVPRGDDAFTACPKPSQQTIWWGSSDGRAFDRLTVAVAPYEAGPWAEGAYEIHLPVTSRLIAALRPADRAAFAPARQAGSTATGAFAKRSTPSSTGSRSRMRRSSR